MSLLTFAMKQIYYFNISLGYPTWLQDSKTLSTGIDFIS